MTAASSREQREAKKAREREKWDRALDARMAARETRRRALRARKPGLFTRRHRRLLACGCVTAMLLLFAAAGLEPALPTTPWLLLWLAGLAVLAASTLRLVGLNGAVSENAVITLDERERAIRFQAGHRSARIVIGLVLALAGYAFALGDAAHAGSRAGLMALAVFVSAISVPTVVLGWTLPDDAPDGEDER